MANSPHEAITYKGNNHIIEYNSIHDVCLLSDDAGAIHSGRSWVWYGNIIRYNCIYNVGSGEHKPDGIYLDDALSGQHIYGNLLINIPRNSIHIGGGDMWDALYDSPWQSEIWQNAFSEYRTMTDDISKSESAEYIPNPACTVKGNLILNKYSEIGYIYIFLHEDSVIYLITKCIRLIKRKKSLQILIREITVSRILRN